MVVHIRPDAAPSRGAVRGPEGSIIQPNRFCLEITLNRTFMTD